MCVAKVLLDCILTLLLNAFKFKHSVFGEIFVFADFVVCFVFFLVVFLMADLVSALMRLGIMFFN